MTLTIDELVKVFHDAYGAQPYSGVGHFDLGSRAGIRAVVTALRDEIIPEKMRITHANDTCTRTSLRRYFHEILAPREGGQAAGDPLSDEARALLSSWKGHGPLPEGQQAPAAPAPTVGQRLIKAAHEAAAIARGEATAPAPAVCVWTDVGDAYRSACGRSHFAWTSRDGVVVCPHCKALIKFTEAK